MVPTAYKDFSSIQKEKNLWLWVKIPLSSSTETASTFQLKDTTLCRKTAGMTAMAKGGASSHPLPSLFSSFFHYYYADSTTQKPVD